MLGAFVEFLGHPTLKDLTLDGARRFVEHLQAQDVLYANHPLAKRRAGKLSERTIHAHVGTLKTFSAWLQEEGLTRTDIFARLQRPRLPPVIVVVLLDEEISAILTSIHPNTIWGARAYAIVLLRLATSLRASELPL